MLARRAFLKTIGGGAVSVGPYGRTVSATGAAIPARRTGTMGIVSQSGTGSPIGVLGPVPTGRTWMLERILGELVTSGMVGQVAFTVTAQRSDPHLSPVSTAPRNISAPLLESALTELVTVDFVQPAKVEAGEYVVVYGSAQDMAGGWYQYLDCDAKSVP